MKQSLAAISLVLVSVFTGINSAHGYELSGQVSAEAIYFTNDALFPGQEASSGSVMLTPEFYHQWENDSALVFRPFVRVDSTDAERTHLDIRELKYLLFGETWELRLGIDKVFWGTTEFVHLVDIVNQTDLVESIDGEEKLGQPMLYLSLIRDWGIVDIFILPYFRERTFPGTSGRFRPALVVDTDNPRFESGQEEKHIDYTLRYSHSIGAWDIGLSHFIGTSREPTLVPGADNSGNLVLIPLYEQINQTGLDLQLVAGSWLLKLEAVRRTGQGTNDYYAADTGFEYTFNGVFGSAVDLGIIAEYTYDNRGDAATTPYQNDLGAALRFSFNDINGTFALIGFVQDFDTSARYLSVEASRRFGTNIRVNLDAYAFLGLPPSDPLHSLQNDDFIRLELAWYF